MSKEEKKAIEITKTIIEFAGDSYIPKENRNALQTLLNLIEKQKKQYQQLQAFHEKDYISKDKIRKALKEIEENNYNCYDSCLVLRELLGEE